MVLQFEKEDRQVTEPGVRFWVYALREKPGGPLVERPDPDQLRALLAVGEADGAVRRIAPRGGADCWVMIEGNRSRGDFSLRLKVRVPNAQRPRPEPLVPFDAA
jgi:hypothetical protein